MKTFSSFVLFLATFALGVLVGNVNSESKAGSKKDDIESSRTADIDYRTESPWERLRRAKAEILEPYIRDMPAENARLMHDEDIESVLQDYGVLNVGNFGRYEWEAAENRGLRASIDRGIAPVLLERLRRQEGKDIATMFHALRYTDYILNQSKNSLELIDGVISKDDQRRIALIGAKDALRTIRKIGYAGDEAGAASGEIRWAKKRYGLSDTELGIKPGKESQFLKVSGG